MAKAKHSKQRQKQDRTMGVLWIIIGVCLVTLTALLASGVSMIGWEEAVFRQVNNWPEEQRLFWLGATMLGSEFALLGGTLLLLCLRYYRAAVRLLSVGTVTVMCSEALKLLIDRPRPAGLVSDVYVRQSILGNGYPSSHTALAVVLAVVICQLLPGHYRWLGVLWVSAVAMSRLYLGVHSPFDVMGGAAVGLIVVSRAGLARGKLRTVTKITGLRLANRRPKA